MFIGHVIGTTDGIIQGIDESVAVILQRTQAQLVGQSYASITHPLDLAKSRTAIDALKDRSDPVTLRKRYIAGEGGIVTLELQMGRMGVDGGRHLIGTLSTPPLPKTLDIAPIEAGRRPDRLWHHATDLLAIMQARDAALGGDLFADHAWRLLLAVYVAEAESRIVTTESVAAALGLSFDSVRRWVRVLRTRSLIDQPDAVFAALQLTAGGICNVERLLARHPVPAISLADQ